MNKMKIAHYSLYATVLLMLASCSTTRNVHSYSWQRKPKFIDSISLGGNTSKVSTTTPENSYTFNNGLNNSNQPVYNKEFDPATANILQLKYASLLGIIPQMITNIPLYGFIDEWYGVCYKLGGCDKKGIDCSAFVQKLYEHVYGVNLVRTAFEQFNNCTMTWDMEGLKEGDLVFFYTYTYSRRKGKKRITGKRISHVGVYLANNRFVHASTSRGVMISSLGESYWSKKFAGAGQISKG